MNKKIISVMLGVMCLFTPSSYANDVKVGDVVNVSLHELIPTQPSVGYDQIMYKLGRYQFDREKMFDEVCEANGQKGMGKISANANPNNPSSFTCQLAVGKRKQDMKTVVIAPDGDYYLTDGHHTFNVFYEMPEGGADFHVNVVVAKDYRDIKGMDKFWTQMQKDGNTWLFDVNSNPIGYDQLPTSLGIKHFQNDLYRSLMYFTRGVSWDKPDKPVPFLEFYWSQEVRKKIDATIFNLNSKDGYAKAVKTVSEYILAVDTTDVGGSNLSAKQMGQFNAYDKKAFKKLFKDDGKIDYLLRYKATLSEKPSQ
ncbi:chromosome partitioning protein ParB [Vibrio sp. S17_S38]|uniref:ParB/Srx family N-terminal domain-containing protein n=1 Tax=Vibrio sp. S17_S38 TaxID=2720229 RepID=UPI00167FF88C|nr:ParB/Srx family N-terminal domain-containing protein [Vibrio sp. S17_S38]MBD1574299.1 chromosome partitioning protein ParB [Vibrio sp. S17_S38]